MQGIGQALMEHAVYNEDGQLVTGTLMDYALPRAADGVSITFETHNTGRGWFTSHHALFT